MKNNKTYAGYARRGDRGFSAVHISPRYATTGNLVDFQATAEHELIHAYHIHTCPVWNADAQVYSERVAYNHSANVYMTNGNIMNAIEQSNFGISLYGSGPVPMTYKYIPFLHK